MNDKDALSSMVCMKNNNNHLHTMYTEMASCTIIFDWNVNIVRF